MLATWVRTRKIWKIWRTGLVARRKGIVKKRKTTRRVVRRRKQHRRRRHRAQSGNQVLLPKGSRKRWRRWRSNMSWRTKHLDEPWHWHDEPLMAGLRSIL